MPIETILVEGKYRMLLRSLSGMLILMGMTGSLVYLVTLRPRSDWLMLLVGLAAVLSVCSASQSLYQYSERVIAYRTWKMCDTDDKRTIRHIVYEIEKLSTALVTPDVLVAVLAAFKEMRATEPYKGAHADHVT